MDLNQFASRLKELRESAGLTQQQLADRAGVGQRSVSHWEQAAREPTWFNVLALARALGVSCEAFDQEPAGREPQGRGRPRKAEEQAPAPPRTKGRRRKGT